MTTSTILAAVAQRHGITTKALLTGATRRVAAMRQEAMWEMRQLRWANGKLRYSTTMIGRAVSRDHSTVIYGLRRHAQRIEKAG